MILFRILCTSIIFSWLWHAVSCEMEANIEISLVLGDKEFSIYDFDGDAQIKVFRKVFIFPESRIEGQLMAFHPLDACSDLENERPFTRYNEDYQAIEFETSVPLTPVIVFATRGMCSFEEKFDIVERISNVVALILVNGNSTPSLPPNLDLSNGKNQLPGLLVSNSIGLMMEEYLYRVDTYNSKKNKTANSNSTIDGWVKAKILFYPSGLTTVFEILLISILSLLTIFFLISVILSCYNSRYRQQPSPSNFGIFHNMELIEDGNARLERVVMKHTLAPSMLRKIPEKAFDKAKISSCHATKVVTREKLSKNNEGSDKQSIDSDDIPLSHIAPKMPSKPVTPASLLQESSNVVCAICLDDFENGDRYRELPCHHIFHSKCVDPWLTRNSSLCPMCKEDIEISLFRDRKK